MSEWINEKIKEEVIKYFEYDEFSSIEEIGKGGFGTVSRAYLDNKALHVALKSFDVNLDNEKDMINEFIKELKLLRKVYYHENINSFLGITKVGNCYDLVLEYANEGNLRNYLKSKFNWLKWEDKIQMALDITCGLKCLHSEDIIHRDLHSKNILVNNGKLLIADLGLSKQLVEVASNSTNSIANNMGMIEYIDPQHFKIANYKKDKRSDIYSLGVLLWEISSGHPPFPDYPRDLLGPHISYEKRREKPIPGTPLEYELLYQKCWDGVPNSRPNIEEVHKILRQLRTIEPSSQSNFDNFKNEQEESLKNNPNNADSKQFDLSISRYFCNETERQAIQEQKEGTARETKEIDGTKVTEKQDNPSINLHNDNEDLIKSNKIIKTKSRLDHLEKVHYTSHVDTIKFFTLPKGYRTGASIIYTLPKGNRTGPSIIYTLPKRKGNRFPVRR